MLQTKAKIVDALAHAAIRGRLGLFIGAGFSRAVVSEAPTWLELLKEVCCRLKLDMEEAQEGVGTPLPRMASRLVSQIEKRLAEKAEEEEVAGDAKDGRFGKRALWKFKSEVANVTKELELQAEDESSWRELLGGLTPAWIVTTNYDLLIEEILPHATTLRPSEVMSHSREGTPVYHMHGHQEEPRALVITEEDYTRLFRPGEYRQQKLPILIAESVVLFLGYGLGDTNVLTAIDLASMYRTPDNAQLIQALRKGSESERKDEPYKGASAETIIEVPEIRTFLEEIQSRTLVIGKEQDQNREKIATLRRSSDEKKKLANGNVRIWAELIYYTRSNGSSKVAHEIIDSLTKELGGKAAHDWAVYEKLLTVIIYSFVGLGEGGMHPALITPLYNAFARISSVIDPDESSTKKRGNAWKASEEWHRLKAKIPKPVVRQLRSRAVARRGNDGKKVKLLLERLDLWSFLECEKCGASISTECQTCGTRTGGISVDENRDDTYFEIHCHDCGWEVGEEVF